MSISASKITTQLEWTDLRLAEETLKQIRQLQIRPGYKALFYGPAGVGKKLTTILLAKTAGIDVYRVDVSALLSKYSAETEKHLDRIFTEAASHKWMLFFDEADALFGKRTDIKDAHDKYANQAINALLQRMEDFPGALILATHTKQNTDHGFVRKLTNIVSFIK